MGQSINFGQINYPYIPFIYEDSSSGSTSSLGSIEESAENTSSDSVCSLFELMMRNFEEFKIQVNKMPAVQLKRIICTWSAFELEEALIRINESTEDRLITPEKKSLWGLIEKFCPPESFMELLELFRESDSIEGLLEQDWLPYLLYIEDEEMQEFFAYQLVRSYRKLETIEDIQRYAKYFTKFFDLCHFKMEDSPFLSIFFEIEEPKTIFSLFSHCSPLVAARLFFYMPTDLQTHIIDNSSIDNLQQNHQWMQIIPAFFQFEADPINRYFFLKDFFKRFSLYDLQLFCFILQQQINNSKAIDNSLLEAKALHTSSKLYEVVFAYLLISLPEKVYQDFIFSCDAFKQEIFIWPEKKKDQEYLVYRYNLVEANFDLPFVSFPVTEDEEWSLSALHEKNPQTAGIDLTGIQHLIQRIPHVIIANGIKNPLYTIWLAQLTHLFSDSQIQALSFALDSKVFKQCLPYFKQLPPQIFAIILEQETCGKVYKKGKKQEFQTRYTHIKIQQLEWENTLQKFLPSDHDSSTDDMHTDNGIFPMSIEMFETGNKLLRELINLQASFQFLCADAQFRQLYQESHQLVTKIKSLCAKISSLLPAEEEDTPMDIELFSEEYRSFFTYGNSQLLGISDWISDLKKIGIESSADFDEKGFLPSRLLCVNILGELLKNLGSFEILKIDGEKANFIFNTLLAEETFRNLKIADYYQQAFAQALFASQQQNQFKEIVFFIKNNLLEEAAFTNFVHEINSASDYLTLPFLRTCIKFAVENRFEFLLHQLLHPQNAL